MKNLPRVARDLVDLVGMTAALALINAYPGVTIDVPRGVRDCQMLRRLRGIMGAEAADKFVQHHAGNPFTVPMCKAAMRDARDAEIISRVDSGEAPWKVALEFGMHERSVWRVLKRSPGETVSGLGERSGRIEDQMSLF